jgi:ketosteroid isomerase-like protein
MCHIATNAEIIERTLERFTLSGGPDWSLYDEDAVFTTRGELAGRTEYRGHDGYRRLLEEYGESWAEIRGEPASIEEVAEDVVVASIRWHVTAHSEVELDVDEAWTCWFRDGRFVRIEQYATREEALAAAASA